MERIVEQGLLYDFYGELLTEHQRYIYEAVVLNDLSLSEMAQEQGISRQGVHDLIKRCDKILAEYEEKLHLVEKFNKIKACVRQIETAAGTLTDSNQTEQIKRLANEILMEL
ncbi:MAG: YlxM family DNA-binding protein [Lachnospiraceae bacterium]|nr:YlxM family DNA-binding protein [Lachnospiraceae bacterium]